MAIAVVQSDKAVNNSAATATVTLSAPTDGNLMVAMAGHYWKNASETLTITTPASSYTERVATSDTSFEAMARAFTDTFAPGDGNSIVATASGSADNGTVLWVGELSGAAGYRDGKANKTGAAATAISVAAATATIAGTKAFLMVVRQRQAATGTPSYTKTGTTSATWSEVTKVQGTGTGVEIYVAEASNIGAGETIGCDFSLAGATASDMAIITILIDPVTNVAPTVSDPGTQDTGLGYALAIGTLFTIGDTDGNLGGGSIRYQCGSGKGTFQYTASGTSSISAGANNSNDLTITADTQADLLAAHALTTYTSAAENTTDTVTVTATDDEAASDSQAITVNLSYLDISADNQADLNTQLGQLTAQSAVAGIYTVSIVGVADDALEGTGAGTVTVEVGGLSIELMEDISTRRRRR